MSKARLNASGSRRELGEVFTLEGNVKPVSSLFPNVCLTDFAVYKNVLSENYPDFVPWLRAIKLIYNEGMSPVDSWSFTSSGSVVTVGGTSVNDMMADLQEDFLAWQALGGTSAYRTVNLNGTDYLITDVDADANEITVATTPPASGTLIIYTNRIADTTTQARIFSKRGKTLIGAGTTETLAMMMRRDQMQQITGSFGHYWGNNSNQEGALSAVAATSSRPVHGSAQNFRIDLDSANSPDARTGTTTHSPDVSVHVYQHVGRVIGV